MGFPKTQILQVRLVNISNSHCFPPFSCGSFGAISAGQGSTEMVLQLWGGHCTAKDLSRTRAELGDKLSLQE